MEAIIFVGLQASGKSTFYKNHYFNTHLRDVSLCKTVLIFPACCSGAGSVKSVNCNRFSIARRQQNQVSLFIS